MNELSPQNKAGMALKKLIKANYSSQEEFAYDFGTDVRTVNRYVNNGINKIDTIQELAVFFRLSFFEFFEYANEE